MQALIRRSLGLAAVLAVGTLMSQTPPLLDANFNNGTKTGWLNSSGTGGVDVDTDKRLSILAGRHALTYFTPAASRRSLTNGESLTASFDLSFTQVGTGGGGFRLGLFDSQGDRRGDETNTGFNDYTGYVFTLNPSTTSATGLKLLARSANSSLTTPDLVSLISTTNHAQYTDVGVGQTSAFGTNTTYRVSYTVNRGTGEGLTFALSVSVSGGPLVFTTSFNVPIPVTSTFDSFALYSLNNNPANGTLGSNFAIDNVLITAVPEPSTYAACAGAAVLGLAFWRRRRAAAKALAA
jgi:hypothetical protein